MKSPSIVFKVLEWQYVDMYIFDEEFYAALYADFKIIILGLIFKKSAALSISAGIIDNRIDESAIVNKIV